MRPLVYAVFYVSLAVYSFNTSSPGLAATVEKVLSNSDSVIIKLGSKELKNTRKGSDIVIKTPSGDVDAEVKEISGSKAKVYIVFGIDKVAEGQKVSIKSQPAEKKKRLASRDSQKSTDSDDILERNSSSFDSGSKRLANPEGPYDGTLGFPFRLNGSNLMSYGAAHSYRVQKWAGFARIGKMDSQTIEKVKERKTTADIESTLISVGGIYTTPLGLRVGLLGAKLDESLKVKYTSESQTINAKSTGEAQSIGFLVGYAFSTRFSVGVRHMSVEYEKKTTNQMSSVKGSQQSSQTHASFAYYTDDYEAALLYHPAISIRESDISIERPARISLDYFRTLNSSTKLIFELSHIYHSAQSPDDRNQQTVKLGGELKSDFGYWGALVDYKSRYYKNKIDANGLNIASYGLEGFADFKVADHQRVGLILGVESNEGEGEEIIEDEKEDTKIQTQSIRLELVFNQVL